MPSDGARNDHCDDGDDHKMIKCSTWKRRKRIQNPMEIKAKVLLRFFGFGDQDTIEGVITFTIDNRTIKRRILSLSCYRVPIGIIVHVLAFGI